MKETMALALQQKAVGPVLKTLLPMAPELVDKLVVPICDALKTCFCKDALAKVEIHKIWAAFAPQYMEQLDNFFKLMGQFIDTVNEYDKLTASQTNIVIEKICSDPQAPFAEKQAAIREIIQKQYEHKEKQTKTYVQGSLRATAIVAGVAATKILSDNRTKQIAEASKVAKVAKIVDGFSPAGWVKAAGKAAEGVIKAVKK